MLNINLHICTCQLVCCFRHDNALNCEVWGWGGRRVGGDTSVPSHPYAAAAAWWDGVWRQWVCVWESGHELWPTAASAWVLLSHLVFLLLSRRFINGITPKIRPYSKSADETLQYCGVALLYLLTFCWTDTDSKEIAQKTFTGTFTLQRPNYNICIHAIKNLNFIRCALLRSLNCIARNAQMFVI